MIYTITFNPSLDYIVSVENFATGKVNRATDERILPGGKGINVSQVLTNLGVENIALGFVAGFTGAQLEHLLNEKGIRQEFIQLENGMTRINVKLRSETEINGQGPLVSRKDAAKLLEKIKTCLSTDTLVLAGSIPKGISQDVYTDILAICNEKGIRTVVDTSGTLLWNALEYRPFLIKPNHHELGEVFGQELSTREEIILCARKLQEKGARNVLVSRGGEGAVLLAEDGHVYESEAPKGEVINTVGAGDSMVAGFLAGYIAQESYTEALKLGICAGSASAFSEELATRDAVEFLLDFV